jgi:hypothetical protein
MKNTTKLKQLLQLYTISLDADENEIMHLTLIDKRNRISKTFTDKTYTVVIRLAHSYMLKELKKSERIILHQEED